MMKFDRWIEILRDDIIQGEFGYEPGEFTVYREHWRPLFKKGLTPRRAWQRALDAFAEARREKNRLKMENWARIQREDVCACISEKQLDWIK
jgi:hypothetical protein